jgi:hypothetical protein
MKNLLLTMLLITSIMGCKKKSDPSPTNTIGTPNSQEFLSFDFDGKHHSYGDQYIPVNNINADSCNGKSVNVIQFEPDVVSGQYGTTAILYLLYFQDSSAIASLPKIKYEFMPDSMAYQFYNCPFNAILKVDDNLGVSYTSIRSDTLGSYYNKITGIKYLGIDVNQSVLLISGNFNCILKPDNNPSGASKMATNGSYAVKIKVSRI